MPKWQRILAVALLLGCGACTNVSKRDEHFGAYRVDFSALAGWNDDDQSQALASFQSSCPILARKPRPATSLSRITIPGNVWQSLCAEAAQVPPGDMMQARQFFERRFVPYRITNNAQEHGLFTGYYEPILFGSYKHTSAFNYPLYIAPPELARKKPFFTHAEINRGALAKRGLELVWVDDPVMIFFLHIQGSGRVRFSDGSEILVGYAGGNGHGYVSLGKIMGDEGLLPKDQINFFTLRQWLYDHPDRAFAMMERNPSYIFFKKISQPGAVGAVGAVLTPQRSLAVDNRYIPYGLPLFLETDAPSPPGGSPWLRRLVIAQDTGGAIKGPIRGDVFFGSGVEAEYYAGYMKGHGVYSLFVPKEAADALQ